MSIKEHGISHNRSQDLIDYAYRYAKHAHEEVGQLRRYTGEPYIMHPVAVAQLVHNVTDDCNMICAALLHDVIEDTKRTYDDLIDPANGFGKDIVDLVMWLTEKSVKSDGNRAIRKAIDRNFLAQAPHQAKTIKLADLIHNTGSIVQYAPGFAKIYMAEKKLLLEVLVEGHSVLFNQAADIVHDYYNVTVST